MISGTSMLLYGFIFADTNMNVNHISEFNQTYAQEEDESIFDIIPSDDEDTDLEASDVHNTINHTEISSENADSLREIIDTDDNAKMESTQNLGLGRFIITFDDGSQHVFEATPDGFTPRNFIILGLILSVFGSLIYTNIRAAEEYVPDGLVEKEDDDWRYYIDDDDE